MVFKRPKSVLIIVYTHDTEVLMLERTQPLGFWQSVTGSLHQGETSIEAAQRELEEETGLVSQLTETDLENHFPIAAEWRDRYAAVVTHNHETVFAVALDSIPQIQLNPQEHSRYCWLPRELAATKASSWTNRDAILALVPESV